jgi:hypothetical protein
MPTTGPAAPAQQSDQDDRGDQDDRQNHDLDDHDQPDQPDHDDRLGAFDGSERDRADEPTHFQQPRRSRDGRGFTNDPATDPAAEPAAPAKPASARPKRRSHTDGNTPLLTRAFDAAASRVRPSSTMESLIPRTPPLPELPNVPGRSVSWSAVRFS